MRIILWALLVLWGCGEKTTDGPDASRPLNDSQIGDAILPDSDVELDAATRDASVDVDALGPDAALSECGNGALEDGEECDDGNPDGGDGCAENCLVEEGYECNGTPSVCSPTDLCSDDINRATIMLAVQEPTAL